MTEELRFIFWTALVAFVFGGVFAFDTSGVVSVFFNLIAFIGMIVLALCVFVWFADE